MRRIVANRMHNWTRKMLQTMWLPYTRRQPQDAYNRENIRYTKNKKQKPIMLVWIRRTMPRRLVVEISK